MSGTSALSANKNAKMDRQIARVILVEMGCKSLFLGANGGGGIYKVLMKFSFV
ncbi:hypothetical protein ACWIUD_04550 [Helicobacter sp. 23-1044]